MNIPLQVDGFAVRVAKLSAEIYNDPADPLLIEQAARRFGRRIDLVTFIQGLPDTTPRFSFHTEWDNLAAMPITTYDHWWTKQIGNKTRNMVRRAEKSGVTVRPAVLDDEFVRGIKGIYDETPIRQGRKFWHYGKPDAQVKKENGTFPDRSAFFGAYLGDTLIGFTKLVWNQRRSQAGLMQIVSMLKHRDKAPTNALIARAVRACEEMSLPYLFYSRFAFGTRQRDSLSDFKENNGFTRIEIPRYFIPLTPIGRVALRLELHRPSLIHYTPERVQVIARDLRQRYWALTSR